MKAVASLAFGIASSIGAWIAITSAASAIKADPEAHRFDTSSSPDLWTTGPVRVDVAKQSYERIPAVYTSYATDAPKVRIAASNPDTILKASGTERQTLSAEHLNWCGARYRSYDPVSNSYRSYSGQTKPCMSPYAELVTAGSEMPPRDPALAENAAAATWCAARYQSYRRSDNSYQPYEGPRRHCITPTRQEVALVR